MSGLQVTLSSGPVEAPVPLSYSAPPSSVVVSGGRAEGGVELSEGPSSVVSRQALLHLFVYHVGLSGSRDPSKSGQTHIA